MKLSQGLCVLLMCLPVAAFGQDFAATLSGANEVQPGDPDGTGNSSIRISGTTLNYSITVSNVTLPPVMQHIHIGPAGVNGPIVVNLPGPWVGGTLTGTTTTTTAIAAAIVANPAGHYVNVHTTDFPAGAVRGQLAQVFAPVPALGTGSVITLALLLALGAALLLRARSSAA